MLGCLAYAFLFAGNVKHKSILMLTHCIGMLVMLFIFNISNVFFNIILAWSALFFLWGGIHTFKSIFLQRLNLNEPQIKTRILIAFMAMLCLYLFAVVVFVPNSEQERYRFAVEGLLLTLFLFWSVHFLRYIRNKD